MPKRVAPTADEVIGYMKSLSNWGRWGKDDQLGTLNLITPQKVTQAAALVHEGVTVTCARPIVFENSPDITSIPPLHYMFRTGTESAATGQSGALDFIGLAYHGVTITHLDSLSHQFWDGKMYNGLPASLVGAEKGATAGGVDLVKDGVVTRGVLLDIARLRGVDWLPEGEGVFPEDLEAAEKAQEVRVGPGDALLVRLAGTSAAWKKVLQRCNREGLGCMPPACPGFTREESPFFLPTPPTTSRPAVTLTTDYPSTASASWPWAYG